MAMMAAASMTQDSEFHMKPRNLRTLLSCLPSYYIGTCRHARLRRATGGGGVVR